MQQILLSFVFIFSLFAAPALAGPEGSYEVQGTNPGSGTPYSGRVEVSRNGDTYTVVWNVGGVEYIGTGLGATTVKGVTTMGPVDTRDTALAVSYIADGTFGQAFYVEQENGDWQGIWAYGGATKIGTEVWKKR